MSFKSNNVNTSSLYEIPYQNISISIYEEAKDIDSFNKENIKNDQINKFIDYNSNSVKIPFSEFEITTGKECKTYIKNNISEKETDAKSNLTPLLNIDKNRNNECCLCCILC